MRVVDGLMAKRPDGRPEDAEAARALLLPWVEADSPEPVHAPTEAEALAEYDVRPDEGSLWDVSPLSETGTGVIDLAEVGEAESTTDSAADAADRTRRWLLAAAVLAAAAGLAMLIAVLIAIIRNG